MRLKTIRAQAGFVVPAALIVLMVLLLLLAAVVFEATSTTETGAAQLDAIRAQDAADAGLRAATYEYNALGLDGSALLTGMGLSKYDNTWSDPTTPGVIDPQISAMNPGDGPEQVLGACYTNTPGASVTASDSGSYATGLKWCPPLPDDIGTAGSSGDDVSYSYVISQPTQSINSLVTDDISPTDNGLNCINPGDCLISLVGNLVSTILNTALGWLFGNQSVIGAEFGATDTRTVVSTGIAGNQTRVVEDTIQMTGDVLDQWVSNTGDLATCLFIHLDCRGTTGVFTARDAYGNWALNAGDSSTSAVGASGFIITQYYTEVPGSYRVCDAAAASVPAGSAVPPSDCTDD